MFQSKTLDLSRGSALIGIQNLINASYLPLPFYSNLGFQQWFTLKVHGEKINFQIKSSNFEQVDPFPTSSRFLPKPWHCSHKILDLLPPKTVTSFKADPKQDIFCRTKKWSNRNQMSNLLPSPVLSKLFYCSSLNWNDLES